jgi:anti-sigma regulatory factor (Ser/Thr protein kinase)
MKRLFHDDLEKALLRAGGGPVDLRGWEAVDLGASAVLLAHLRGGGGWTPPADARNWLDRTGFDAAVAEADASREPRDSDVLLEWTKFDSEASIGPMLERVYRHASEFLVKHLGYAKDATGRFAVALAELCQNVPQHAEGPGWAAIHLYRPREGAVVKIAVTDAGRGVRASLGKRGGARSDLEALEAVFERHVSRFEDAGRGHGLRSVRRLAESWGAKLTLRSGTAKLSYVPRGMRGFPRSSGLARVAGTQVLMVIPRCRK